MVQMATLMDYLEWRGDIPICEEVPLNEVDGMILARFSYLPFDKIDMNKWETIGTISYKMSKLEKSDYKRRDGDDDLIASLGKCRRFSDMVVTDFVKDTNLERQMQFSAVSIRALPDHMFLTYCGTDSTLVGWKEDFNMSFMEKVPSQLAGCRYIETLASKYPDMKFSLAGHSKGGNIAVYSAATASPEIQHRIIGVWNYDGPGFQESFVDAHLKGTELPQKIKTFIPQESVFGRMLEHAEEFEVIKSTNVSIYQHDIYSWQVMRDSIIRSEKTTVASNITDKSIRKVLEDTTPEQRKIFIDCVYDIMSSTDAKTVDELMKFMFKYVPTMLKKYSGMSADEKKLMTDMIFMFMKSYFSTLSETESSWISKKAENASSKASEIWTNVKEELNAKRSEGNKELTEVD